ncbi:MAG: hypothetical protein QN155_07965 [Armatimonadota bacterium]|nr:hypothetical protein [Armatimonadota bacterium]MDR7404903.1 hypothetical protein [Armatimonadota bacterium]
MDDREERPMMMYPHDLRAAEALAAAVCRQAGAAPDRETWDRLVALVEQGMADGEALAAADVSDTDPPAADRPQDALP